MIGGGGEEVSIVPVYILVGRLVSHHFVIFRLLVLLLNLLILFLLSLSQLDTDYSPKLSSDLASSPPSTMKSSISFQLVSPLQP